MKEKLIGKKYLPHRTVIGFVLGIIAGLLFKDFSVWVLPFGTAFMNLIKMLIVPVIFFSLVSGISAIGDVNRLKRVGVKIVATYVVMTVVSCFIGIAVVSITHPGAGFDTSVLTAYDPSNLTTPSFGGFLLGMIPTNIVSSMANQDIMQMVFFTMILAIALVIVGEKAKVVTEFMNQSANVIYKMLDIIMIYSPIGVFALMANTTAVYGAQLFGNLAKFVLTDYISCLLAWFAFSIFIKYYTGIRYGRMCKAMVPIWINTVATNSSAGTIPITMDVTTNRMGLPFDLTSFSIPLGATINMGGTAIYQGVCSLFIASCFGVTLTMPQMLTIIFTATLASVGTAGVPSAGMIMLAMVLTQVGLPVEGIAIIAGVDKLFDMGRTTLNITGDATCALWISRTEREKKARMAAKANK